MCQLKHEIIKHLNEVRKHNTWKVKNLIDFIDELTYQAITQEEMQELTKSKDGMFVGCYTFYYTEEIFKWSLIDRVTYAFTVLFYRLSFLNPVVSLGRKEGIIQLTDKTTKERLEDLQYFLKQLGLWETSSLTELPKTNEYKRIALLEDTIKHGNAEDMKIKLDYDNTLELFISLYIVLRYNKEHIGVLKSNKNILYDRKEQKEILKDSEEYKKFYQDVELLRALQIKA